MVKNRNSGDFVKIILNYFVKIKANFNWNDSAWAFRRCLVTYFHLIKQIFMLCLPSSALNAQCVCVGGVYPFWDPWRSFQCVYKDRALQSHQEQKPTFPSFSLFSASTESTQTKVLERMPHKNQACVSLLCDFIRVYCFVLFGGLFLWAPLSMFYMQY